MLFYSTGGQSPKADFREAAICGQAPDRGLYFPEQIPALPKEFFDNLDQYTKEEIAFRVIQPYVGGSIPDAELKRIVKETVDFEFPMVQVGDDIFCLELFHGPTLAFKDVGARFMSRCLGYFAKDLKHKVTVLVATSGDTGGAVAAGFAGVEGVQVVILYPSGKVSKVQEMQLTTWGGNITALEVDGTFDDCQQMVKEAFADKDLREQLFLTSANSINVARWLPQQFYYFFAWQQWKDKDHPPVIAVPSGNFGNICAGLVAHASGMPAAHFVAACNANDAVPVYLQSGRYEPKKAVATISNAMDVGNPSNFSRMLELFHHELGELTSVLSSYSITDLATKTVINKVYHNQRYLLDPHGAVGYLALERYLEQHPGLRGIFLETAHPVKFYDVVEPVIGSAVPLPESIRAIMNKEMKKKKIGAGYASLKAHLQFE